MSEQAPDVVVFREPSDEDAERGLKRPVRILSVTGAKGGAGKSLLASSSAVYLASIGRQVVLVDADVNGANLHTMLGVRRAARAEGAAEVPHLLETPVPVLRLWHAGLDEPSAGQVRRMRRKQLETRLRALDADYVVVDIGTGTSSTLLDFHLAADLSLFVTLPEP